MVSHAWIDHRLSPQPHTMQPRLGPLIASPQEAPHEGEQEAGTGAGSSHGGQGPPETELCEEDRDAHSPTCRGVTRGVPGSMGLLHTPSPLLLTKQGHQMGCRRSQEWSSDSQPTMVWYKYISNVSWDILSLKLFIIHLKSKVSGHLVWRSFVCLCWFGEFVSLFLNLVALSPRQHSHLNRTHALKRPPPCLSPSSTVMQ